MILAGGRKVSGAIAVITGASQGIGREMAQQLACQGHTVVMIARNTPRLPEAAKYVSSACPGANVISIAADLSRMAEVRRLGDEISRRFPKVNVLAHCAAAILPRREVTDEGFEATFATNAMAPFLLSHLLFAPLHNAAPSRVIFFYGGGRGSFDLANLMSDRDYDGWIAYNQTKNADVMVTLELARQWEGAGITVNCIFPGLVKTAILRGIPGYMRAFLIPLAPLLRTPSRGAIAPVWVATAHELANVSGKLFGSFMGNPRREFKLPRVTRDPDRRRHLIELLSSWIGLNTEVKAS
jgi:NAD(P)-dependent dehydrogenase (short-subunit alcohol dehydrogenase family)